MADDDGPPPPPPPNKPAKRRDDDPSEASDAEPPPATADSAANISHPARKGKKRGAGGGGGGGGGGEVRALKRLLQMSGCLALLVQVLSVRRHTPTNRPHSHTFVRPAELPCPAAVTQEEKVAPKVAALCAPELRSLKEAKHSLAQSRRKVYTACVPTAFPLPFVRRCLSRVLPLSSFFQGQCLTFTVLLRQRRLSARCSRQSRRWSVSAARLSAHCFRVASVLDLPFGRSLGGWNACGNFKTTSC